LRFSNFPFSHRPRSKQRGITSLTLGVLVLWSVSLWVFDVWKYHLPSWSRERGTKIRDFAASKDLDPAGHDISQFFKVSNQRALELTEKYKLH
ncbi:MAG: hypothetical protein O3C43_08355, partial [Verrucomicrobia bacterium]|nr:hypothetical protein [Verrucomicrobiota bacterium]